jgi:hypothetical protein
MLSWQKLRRRCDNELRARPRQLDRGDSSTG